MRWVVGALFGCAVLHALFVRRSARRNMVRSSTCDREDPAPYIDSSMLIPVTINDAIHSIKAYREFTVNEWEDLGEFLPTAEALIKRVWLVNLGLAAALNAVDGVVVRDNRVCAGFAFHHVDAPEVECWITFDPVCPAWWTGGVGTIQVNSPLFVQQINGREVVDEDNFNFSFDQLNEPSTAFQLADFVKTVLVFAKHHKAAYIRSTKG